MKLLASATAIRDVTIAKNTERIRGGSARLRGGRLVPLLAGPLVEPSSPIRRTHQRTGQHSGESQLLGVLRELCEFVGVDPALDRMVSRGRAQVLGDGDDVASGSVQVAECRTHLLGRLAHPEDEVALGDQPEIPCRGEHVEAASVGEGRTNALEDPRHGLEVVGQHFGPGLEDLPKLVCVAVEVRDQQLDTGGRVELFDGAHGLRIQPGTAVGQVVARHTGDGGVPQAHRLHAFRDPARVVAVERRGLARVDLAEVAAAAAHLTADQEGGLAVLPALVDVGTAGFLAHGVQSFAADQLLQLGVFRAHPQPGPDPRRLSLDRGFRVAYFQTQKFPTFGDNGHDVDATRAALCCRLTASRPSRASQTASATADRTSSTPTRCPSSAESDVTPASLIPHGTIVSNAPRSQSQLSANPCSVVARDTRTPMAATLRAGRPPPAGTHTPERPSMRPTCRLTSLHTLISDSSMRRT